MYGPAVTTALVKCWAVLRAPAGPGVGALAYEAGDAVEITGPDPEMGGLR